VFLNMINMCTKMYWLTRISLSSIFCKTAPSVYQKLNATKSLPSSPLRDFFPPCGASARCRAVISIYRGFAITLRHATLGRNPPDECSARRRDLYLTTHNTHKRQTSMPPACFEPTIPGSDRPKTYALDRTATGIG